MSVEKRLKIIHMDFQGGGINLNPFLFSQSRLQKQDVGLKTHLQQLDQQINELKLDVNKASTDQMESDSRPSSGVYSHTYQTLTV